MVSTNNVIRFKGIYGVSRKNGECFKPFAFFGQANYLCFLKFSSIIPSQYPMIPSDLGIFFEVNHKQPFELHVNAVFCAGAEIFSKIVAQVY